MDEEALTYHFSSESVKELQKKLIKLEATRVVVVVVVVV